MGKDQGAIRVVLDTNVLVSALLFGGPLGRLETLWREGRIVPLLSRDIFLEYVRVLAYPKFELSGNEIKGLMDECVLPFAEMVTVDEVPAVIREDPDDDKFLALADAGRARFILSGDRHLLGLKRHGRTRILAARDFLRLRRG